jgi:hypothetical protein
MQTRRSMLQAMVSIGAATLVTGRASASSIRKPEIKIFRKHYAPCCEGWLSHVARNGFSVREVPVSDLEGVKIDYDIPKSLIACHTAVVEGYIVEGHVPADAIHKLLSDHPFVRGIAVAGEPVGAPGNEKGKGEKQPYTVVVWDATGKITPFV